MLLIVALILACNVIVTISEKMILNAPTVLNGLYSTDLFQISSQVECSSDPSAKITILAKRIEILSGGKMTCGTAAVPFRGKLNITLSGSKVVNTAPGDGTEERSFVISKGGVLSLHGSPSISWTELAQTADAGTSNIALSETPVGWNVS